MKYKDRGRYGPRHPLTHCRRPAQHMSNVDSATPTLRQDRVRLAVLMAPKPGLSFEEFDRYWLDVHAKVFSSIAIAKRNLLKYEQVSDATGRCPSQPLTNAPLVSP